MKLKDFVFNSLRVRRKKKKASSSGSAAVGDLSPGCFGLDKNRNWFPSAHSRSRSQGSSFEEDSLIDANWQGNALYKGLVIREEIKENCALVALDYSLGNPGRIPHNNFGTSSSFITFDRALDNNPCQDTISENLDSYSSMSPVSEADTESSPTHPQCDSYHYHHERHNIHTEHDFHSKKVTTLLQQHNQSIDNIQNLGFKYSQTSKKPEIGFFRKSLASLKNIRKDSSKTKPMCSKQSEHVQMDCRVGFFPEDATPVNKMAVYKMPANIKMRGAKLLSKPKVNRDVQFSTENFENQWTLESRNENDVKSVNVTMDPFISTSMLYDRPYVRETSVESCPPRHYSFQEDLYMRDLDLTTFESASYTGYESDVSRSRGRKARSRIKTNPWLPSPQLTHSVASRWADCQVREPNDHIPLLEEDYELSPPDLLEYHKGGFHYFQAYPKTVSRRYHRKHSTRKSPNGIRMALNLNAGFPYSFTKRSLDQQYNSFASCKLTSSRTSSLNDLSNNTPTTREASLFSPNTEFLMLAENLEQLATNISFEYDDTFDTTMESVSAGKETSPSFFREICPDNENSQNPDQRGGQESRIHMTHSPDSGVGGLGHSDGDSNLTPTTQRQANSMSLEYLSSTLPDISCKVLKEVTEDNCISRRKKESRTNSSRDAQKPYFCSTVTTQSSSLSSPQRMICQVRIPPRRSQQEDVCFSEDRSSDGTIDSLFATKASHQDTQMTTTHGACNGPTLWKASHTENTKLGEEECSTTAIRARNDKLFRRSGSAEADVSAPREIIEVQRLDKQSSEFIPAVDETTTVKKSRPSALYTNPRLVLNNIEKESSRKAQQLSWMDEFDFPRNITASESMESPTENWQWDYQFAMYHSLDTGSPGQQLYRVVFDDAEVKKEDVLENERNIEVEELVVRLEDADRKVELQRETSESAGTKSRLINSFCEKLENGALDNENCEMNDACVQTDFDDDFDHLDEMGNVDDLEEGLYDLSEGTHLWLPTDSVGDSWTQDKSQARDFEKMHDEFIAIRSKDRGEQGSADHRCSEKSPQDKLGDSRVETKRYGYPETYSHTTVSADLQVKTHESPLTKVEPRVSEDIMKQLSSEARLLTVEKRPDLLSMQKATIHSSRTTPEKIVHIPFPDIETQVRRIFNQIYDESQINNERRQVSCHNPETTVELPDFDCSPSEQVHREGLPCQRNRGSKANQERSPSITAYNLHCSDVISVSTPPSNTFVNYIKSNTQMLKPDKMAQLSHVDANGNFLYNRSRLKRSSESLQRSANFKRDNFDDFLISSLNANKAAYLTIQNDSPLCRSLAERPLCLVPDANPFSRLRLKPMKSICLNSACDNVNRASWTSSTSSPFYTTSLVTNCKYTHECQNNNQALLQANENVIDLLAQGQSRSQASEAHYSLQILTDQIDNFVLSSPANGKSSQNSEIVSNSVYSFAKAPNYLKCPDFTHTSLLKTVSYSAAGAKRNSGKSKFSSMLSGSQQTTDNTCLAGRVLSLCQEKDLIFQKIYEAKQEEVYRKGHRLQIQRRMQAQTREALLQPLIELKHKLEEQSRRLNEKCNVSGNANGAFRFL